MKTGDRVIVPAEINGYGRDLQAIITEIEVFAGATMEAELPCSHDFRLDGRGNGKNPETEQAGHGRNADHACGMSRHGKGHFLRP